MKKILLALSVTAIATPALADECSYNDIQGTEYRISDKYANYVTNNFQVYPDVEDYKQGDKSLYVSLVTHPFKVTNTKVVTKESSRYDEPMFEGYRYSDVNLDGKAYFIDRHYNIEVTTSDCHKFYFDPAYLDFKDFEYDFVRTDGASLTKQNYMKFLENALKKSDIQAKSEYDKFEKSYKVKTDYFDQYLIRGNFNEKTKKYDFVQLYLDTVQHVKPSEGSINMYQVAKDTDGNSHKVLTIDSSVDCSSSFASTVGCTVKQPLGIDLTEDFLRKHKDGFELKLLATKPFVQEVSGDVVKAFLAETDILRNKK